jgi:hypothetical protein
MPDHAALVTAILIDRPTCLSCLEVKAGMERASLEQTLRVIGTVLVLHRRTDRCRACGIIETVLSIEPMR